MSDSKINPEQFCYLPFFQLLLQPTGVVSPCCWNQEIELGRVPHQKLEEIWNGEEIRKLRREFLNGNPVSCAKQMRHLQCHRWSARPEKREISLAEVLVRGPERLDIRLNGQCNLQCVMCDVWRQPNGVYNHSDFWTWGREKIFPWLQQIDMLGGEPFVQVDTYRLIDEISATNPDCTWAFVTNGNYKFSSAIQSRLAKIKIRWLQVSLDSVRPATYERVRRSGDLSQVLQLLDDLQGFRRRRQAQGDFNLVISMCVQQENIFEVGEFLEFARARGLEPVLQFAYEPRQVSVLSLESEELTEIYFYLKDLALKFGSEILRPISLPIEDSLRESRVLAPQIRP